MLFLGFIGVIVTDIRKDGAWNYWRVLCVIYALISLGMSWHLKRRGWKTTALTVWHEIAHWAGLFGSIFVTSWFVHIGALGRFEASLLGPRSPLRSKFRPSERPQMLRLSTNP
jgi:hypothetical protein